MCEEHRQLQSQEPAKKENQEPSHGTDNRFAQPAAPCQTTETFMGTQKATGAVSLEEKRVPAEPSLLEPSQRPLLSPVSALLPLFLPQQQLPVVARKNFAPFSCGCLQGFVTLCSAGGFTHSYVTNPASNPNPYIHIFIYIYKYSAQQSDTLERVKQAFQGILCCSTDRFLLP